MQGIKAAGDRDLIFHKPLEKAMSLDFNFEKVIFLCHYLGYLLWKVIILLEFLYFIVLE